MLNTLLQVTKGNKRGRISRAGLLPEEPGGDGGAQVAELRSSHVTEAFFSLTGFNPTNLCNFLLKLLLI